MTEEELTVWGRQEHEKRLDDMARIRSGTLSLVGAQSSALLRSWKAGLTLVETDQALRLARVARTA